MLLGAYLLLGGPWDHHDEVLASLPLNGARLAARPLVYYVYTSTLVRSGPYACTHAYINGGLHG